MLVDSIITILGSLTTDVLLLLTQERIEKRKKVIIDDDIKFVLLNAMSAAKIKLDVSNLGQMLSTIRSILGSKSIVKV